MSEKQDILIEVNGKKYSYDLIIQRSKFAPDNIVDLSKLKNCHPSCIDIVDNDVIRICKIDKQLVLLSGYNNALQAIMDAKKDNVKPELSVKMMSIKFFDTCEIVAPCPPHSKLADMFKNVGFTVMQGNKVL